MGLEENQLILGDNLHVLKNIPSESVDLCYIDPPFFSNRDYEIICGNGDGVASFSDKWSGGIDHYIRWLKERIEEIWRVLKKTGSLYVHCDWHANAYIRVHILDKLGGKFVNEIIWRYSSGGGSKRFYSKNHDMIYFYTKSKEYIFNSDAVRVARTDKSLERIKNPKGARTNIVDKFPEDVFEIQIINPASKERIGYHTQKPLALLDRIIKASSNKGDIVLDAFCGGGTTLVAAQRLNRKFIGIDQSVEAIAISRRRIEKECGNQCSFSLV
jgi:DNA modification methylase